MKLGKRPARHDARVPFFSRHGAIMPMPPASSNWYADVATWEMLANDQVGDCVFAAILHLILQQESYTMAPAKPALPTDAEAIAAYSAVTGYVPGNPATDQGTYMLGAGGAMAYWASHGITCGGVLNKPLAFLQVGKNPVEYRQAISTFSNLLVGIQLPEAIVSPDVVPDVWRDFSGPVAGGHEILLVGYETLPSGVYYDLVSWGSLYRCTEEFLLRVIEEAATVLNPAFMNAQGTSPAGTDLASLQASMAALGAMG